MNASRMIKVLCAAALFGADGAGAQTDGDSLRVERVAALGQLWSDIELFHPYMAYRDIDWDAAFAAAAPAVGTATGVKEYARIVQEMLGVLGDPVTRLVVRESKGLPSEGEPHPISAWTQDSILVISMTNYVDLEDWRHAAGRLREIGDAIRSAHGVVFDLRRIVAGEAYLDQIFLDGGVAAHLIDTPVSSPGERFRMHKGMRRARGTGFGGFYSGFRIVAGTRFQPSASGASKSVAFLVNAESDLPELALALQRTGQGMILIQGEPTAVPAVTVKRSTLPGSVEVEVRLSERVYPDGSVGFAANTIVPPSRGPADSSALMAAIASTRELSRSEGSANHVFEPFAVSQPDRSYTETAYPSSGYRLLAGVRLWSAVRNFHPHLDLIEKDWDQVLRDFIPRLTAAADSVEYALTIAEMVTHIHDSHGFVWAPAFYGTALGVAPPGVSTRMIEGVPAITKILDDSMTRGVDVELGDVVLTVDDETANERMERYARITPASTPQGKVMKVMENWLSGPEGSIARLRLRSGDGEIKTVELPRKQAHWRGLRRYREDEILHMLPGNIGYADLDRLTIAMVDSMFAMFRDSPAIIFDMRGYPRGTMWSIAPRLTRKERVPIALMSKPVRMGPDPTQSGRLEWTSYLPKTEKGRYSGRTVMLIDERAISAAEFMGMMLRAANGTPFIGSPTMGANGEVTNLELPGGILVNFTGAAVRHPDGSQLQRVGLIPDLHVEPTLAGIRAGRDEVLEAALEFLTDS